MNRVSKASLKQEWFDFIDSIRSTLQITPAPVKKPISSPKIEAIESKPLADADTLAPSSGRDAALENQSREWLTALGIHEGSIKVQVHWNAKLRSTAGYARWPQWKVELNPRLVDFEGQVERTLKHELAHLIAFTRANRRKIEPHGVEWRKACADLGIPDESARHTLPLPRTTQTRNYTYICPVCRNTVARVRKFSKRTACLACCKQHNGGQYDSRFQFTLMKE
jgi:predicted SprT family Zn-dependent metalloprotease